MSNNPVKYEELIKQYSHSILDISGVPTTSSNVTPGPRDCKFACKRGPFIAHGWVGYLTYLGSPTSM